MPAVWFRHEKSSRDSSPSSVRRQDFGPSGGAEGGDLPNLIFLGVIVSVQSSSSRAGSGATGSKRSTTSTHFAALFLVRRQPFWPTRTGEHRREIAGRATLARSARGAGRRGLC